jgi:hypothetical protein
MFQFAIDGASLRFSAPSPAFGPLPQLPPEYAYPLLVAGLRMFNPCADHAPNLIDMLRPDCQPTAVDIPHLKGFSDQMAQHFNLYV